MAAGSGVTEHVVHDTRPAADGGDDDVPVDGLGDVRGLVAHRVADVLDRDTVDAHDRHGGVTTLVSMPVTDAGLTGDPAEPPVERVAGVRGAVYRFKTDRMGIDLGFHDCGQAAW